MKINNGLLKSSSKIIRVLVFSLCSIAVLLMVGIPTYSWVSRNLEAKKEAEMQLENSMVLAEKFTAYKYDDDLKMGKVVASDDVTLPLYDSVFIEKNINNIIIYRAPVFGQAINEGQDFDLSIVIVNHRTITGVADNNYLDGTKSGFDDGNTAIADYISNVCYIKTAIIPELDEIDDSTTEGANQIYNGAHTYFSDDNNDVLRQTFVKHENDTITKEAQLNFTLSDYTPTDGIIYLYIEIGYDATLVKEFANSREFVLDLSKEAEIVSIESDLASFELSIAERG